MKRRVLVAMSGGVDSSAAAALLLEQGYDVAGATMKLFDDGAEDAAKTCCSADDADDARDVCRTLGIEHFVFNFSDDFGEKVIDKFANEYLQGLTPNPCLDCNKYMKFEKFAERAELLGFDHTATGHYARIAEYDGRFVLRKGSDATKDQSYALYAATQAQLSKLLLPIGEFSKQYIRDYAEQKGLTTSRKPDSQDVCFVRGKSYAEFIAERTGIPPKRGLFLDASGFVIGRHDGAINYTIGQRKGINFSSTNVKSTERMFVCEKDVTNNTVVLGFEKDLYSSHFKVKDVNWVGIAGIESELKCSVKIRYNGRDFPATLRPMPFRGEDDVLVVFDEPQRAVVPGQAAVFYDGDKVLGGGVIMPSGNRTGIGHLTILVENAGKAADWYAEKYGLEQVGGGESWREMLTEIGILLVLAEKDKHCQVTAPFSLTPSATGYSIVTKNLRKAKKRLLERGVAFKPTEGYENRAVDTEDLYGTKISVWEAEKQC